MEEVEAAAVPAGFHLAATERLPYGVHGRDANDARLALAALIKSYNIAGIMADLADLERAISTNVPPRMPESSSSQ